MERKNKNHHVDLLKFKLGCHEEKSIYQPEKKNFSFYQFCRMHNPDRTIYHKNNKIKVHEMRKVVYDENYDIIRRKEALIKATDLKKFIDNLPENKYTIYETYEISLVDTPSDREMYTANSGILNGDSFYPAYSENPL